MSDDLPEYKGFRHAFASSEDEAAAELAAKSGTQALKELATKKKLWEKYDKAKEKAQKKKK